MHLDPKNAPEFLKLKPRRLQAVIRHKVADLRKFFARAGFGKAVIGLSGGLDSAVSLALACRALGPQNVIAVRLPFRALNAASLSRAAEAAAACGLPPANLLTVDITAAVEASWRAVAPLGDAVRDLRLGNLAARERMKVLMDVGTLHRALLVGTENRTEELLAYYTIGGDNISNYEPIHNLWKTEVFQVAAALGVPASILDCAPSAELWDGQTDEGEIGCSYLMMDTVLAGRAAGLPLRRLIRRFGLDPALVEKLLARVKKAERKRQAPFRPKR